MEMSPAERRAFIRFQIRELLEENMSPTIAEWTMKVLQRRENRDRMIGLLRQLREADDGSPGPPQRPLMGSDA
jgi:hypothetical protein